MRTREDNQDAPSAASRFVVLEGIQTLEDEYGCDPWDDENHGRHPASREDD